MSFFSKIGKGLKNAGKWVSSKAAPVISKVAGTAAAVTAFVPGVGTVASAALAATAAGAALISKKPNVNSISQAAALASTTGLLPAGYEQTRFGSVLNATTVLANQFKSQGDTQSPPPVIVSNPLKSVQPVAVAAAQDTSDYLPVSNQAVSTAAKKSGIWEIVGSMLGAGVKTATDNGTIGGGKTDPNVKAATDAFAGQVATSNTMSSIWLKVGLGLVALLGVFFIFGRKAGRR